MIVGKGNVFDITEIKKLFHHMCDIYKVHIQQAGNLANGVLPVGEQVDLSVVQGVVKKAER